MSSREDIRPLFTLRTHVAEVAAVTFIPEAKTAASSYTTCASRLLASGDVAGNIKIWNLASRRAVSSANFSPHAPRGVLELQSQGHSTLLSQGRDGCIALWDLGQGGGKPTQMCSLSTYAHGFCRAEFLGGQTKHFQWPLCTHAHSKEGGGEIGDAFRKKMLAESNDVTRRGNPALEESCDVSSMQTNHVGGHGQNVADENSIKNVDALSEPEFQSKHARTENTRDMIGEQTGNHFVVAPAMDGEAIIVWDIRSKQIAAKISTAEAGNGMCMALSSCINEGRPYVYVGMESGAVQLFDLAERKPCGSSGQLTVTKSPLLSLTTTRKLGRQKHGSRDLTQPKQIVICGSSNQEIVTLETDWKTLQTKVDSKVYMSKRVGLDLHKLTINSIPILHAKHVTTRKYIPILCANSCLKVCVPDEGANGAGATIALRFDQRM